MFFLGNLKLYLFLLGFMSVLVDQSSCEIVRKC